MKNNIRNTWYKYLEFISKSENMKTGQMFMIVVCGLYKLVSVLIR